MPELRLEKARRSLPIGYQFGRVPVYCESCGRPQGWMRTNSAAIRVLQCARCLGCQVVGHERTVSEVMAYDEPRVGL